MRRSSGATAWFSWLTSGESQAPAQTTKAPRREAFNIIFSMAAGTPPAAVGAATVELAREPFKGQK